MTAWIVFDLTGPKFADLTMCALHHCAFALLYFAVGTSARQALLARVQNKDCQIGSAHVTLSTSHATPLRVASPRTSLTHHTRQSE